MDRIKERYVDVGGYVIGPETTAQELTDLPIDIAVTRFHARGYLEVLFNKTIVNDGVEFEVSARVANKHEKVFIFLDPKLQMPAQNIMDESRMKQEVCEEWLKRNIDVEPTRDTQEGIVYEFPWGYITSSAATHLNFGNLDGCIIMTYGED